MYMNINGAVRPMTQNRFAKVFKTTADYDDTVVDQFFKDMDKLVGSIRLVSNLRRNSRGMFVEYQNVVETSVCKKLLLNGWRVRDINGATSLFDNRDGWMVEVEKVDTGSNLLATRVTLLEKQEVST